MVVGEPDRLNTHMLLNELRRNEPILIIVGVTTCRMPIHLLEVCS